MRYAIRHATRYRYDAPVSSCHNLAHLLPRDTLTQRCLSSGITVDPTPAVSSSRLDYFGNRVMHFSIQDPHALLDVTAMSEVEVDETPVSLDLDLGITCVQVRGELAAPRDEGTLLAREFRLQSPLVPRSEALAEYARPSFADDRPLLSATRELTERIFREFTYEPGFTTVTTPLHEVLEHRKGVCQDFAHLAIGCLRSLGFAARYVSGYIETQPPAHPAEEAPAGAEPAAARLIGDDASHAWVAVYAPGEGWYEFDPTNDQIVAQQHITVAWGRDFGDVTPLRGVIFGGGEEQQLDVSVSVQRVLSA